MTGVAAAAIAGAAISGYSLYSSEKQKSDAKKLAAGNKLQQQRLPGEVTQATNLAAQNYYNAMPGTTQAQQAIARNSGNAYANGKQGASSGGDLLDLAAKLNYGDSIATNDLAAKGAAYKANALGAYEGQLNNDAEWQAKLYNNNELQPFLRTANTAAAMYGAGSINENNALNGLANSGIAYASSRNPYTPTSTTQATTTSPDPQNYPPYNNVTPYNNGQQMPLGTGWQDFNAAQAMANAKLKKGGY